MADPAKTGDERYKPLTGHELENRNRGLAQSHDLFPAEYRDWLRRMFELNPPSLLPSSIANFGAAVRATLLNVKTVTGAYTAKDSDNVILCNLTSGAYTVTLPTAVDRPGKVFYFVKTDGGTDMLTIDGAGSETINGVASFAGLDGKWEKAAVVSDGSNWLLLDSPTELTYNEFTSPVTISATTEASSNVVVTASAVTFDGATPVLIEAWFPYVEVGAGATIVFVLWDNTAGASIGYLGGAIAGGLTLPDVGLRRRIVPANGSRTYSIRAFRSTANCVVGAGAGGAAAYVPGFIRIIRAS